MYWAEGGNCYLPELQSSLGINHATAQLGLNVWNALSVLTRKNNFIWKWHCCLKCEGKWWCHGGWLWWYYCVSSRKRQWWSWDGSTMACKIYFTENNFEYNSLNQIPTINHSLLRGMRKKGGTGGERERGRDQQRDYCSTHRVCVLCHNKF